MVNRSQGIELSLEGLRWAKDGLCPAESEPLIYPSGVVTAFVVAAAAISVVVVVISAGVIASNAAGSSSQKENTDDGKSKPRD